MTITVDMHQVGMAMTNHNAGVQESVDAVASILRHEYGHTPDYGQPSVPPATGYNNDLCGHQRLYGRGIDRLCELIEYRLSTGGTVASLCALNRDWVNVHNGIPCEGAMNKFPCGACN